MFCEQRVVAMLLLSIISCRLAVAGWQQAKELVRTDRCYNYTLVSTGPKLHLFSRDSGKDAVRGPPGRNLLQSPEENGGVLTLFTGFAGFPIL